MENEFFPYPVKLVQLRREDIKPNRANGSGPKVFGEVTSEIRQNFSQKIDAVEKLYEKRFEKHPNTPAVAKVILRKDAIAKSHRPTSLFSNNTCPIISVGNSNELLIEVTPQRLVSLKHKIMTSQAKKVTANISTMENIVPYTENDIIKPEVKEHIQEQEIQYVKVKLFKFFQEKTNINVEKEFEEHLIKTGAHIEKKLNYAKHLTIYKIKINDASKIDDIIEYGAIKTLSYFPTISPYRIASFPEDEPQSSFPIFEPEPGIEYPYVGVVDTGTREENTYLRPWVECREDFVLDKEKNCEHGSFVSGIISYNNRLIGKMDDYDGVKIIDVTAIPNDDPEYGPVGSLTEDEFVEIIQEVVPKYSGRVKVWNLSLGTENICDEQSFSDLAISLDEIQDENDVIFVIAAGNYNDSLRAWPINSSIKYNDRITSPADSVRAITVGSISQVDSDLSKKYEPSPFSRRGLGPNYITKPEVVDFGGNVTRLPFEINGVISFNEKGQLVRNIGTSFSTPRVATLLAKIMHYFGGSSRNVAKALLIHSAVDRRINQRPKKEDRPYLGFGQPAELKSIFECSKSSSTIIFEGTIHPSTYIEINDFPFPTVLTENGKCFGEITVTLAYDPPLNSDYAFEYCRSNIEVSLGTNKASGFSSEVPLEKVGSLEKELVENGMKWATVKVYNRKISNQGINDYPWKLKLTYTGRSEEVLEPQNFALIVTISDPENQKEVYNDVAQQLQQRFIYSDIQISNRIRPTIS